MSRSIEFDKKALDLHLLKVSSLFRVYAWKEIYIDQK